MVNFMPNLRVHSVEDDSSPDGTTRMIVSDNVDYMFMKICFNERLKNAFWRDHEANAPDKRQIQKGSLLRLIQHTTDMEHLPSLREKVPVIRVEKICLRPPT